jgi:hypothetical protein
MLRSIAVPLGVPLRLLMSDSIRGPWGPFYTHQCSLRSFLDSRQCSIIGSLAQPPSPHALRLAQTH